MQRSIRAALCGAALLGLLAALTAPASARGESKRKAPADSVEGVLSRVDGALFFHDRQEHLDGYEVELATWSAFETDGPIEGPRLDSARRLGTLTVSDGGKTHEGSRTVRAWTPACGSWTLTELMRLEMALLARPWSEVFDAAAWKRSVVVVEEGHVLTVTPKKRARGKMLAPAIKSAAFTLTPQGHPTSATLALDLEVLQAEATLTFTLEDHGEGRKRIARIDHVIPSVNVEIHPVVTLTLGTQRGLDLPAHLEFRVPGRQLAHAAVGKGDSVSYLIYRDYRVRRTDDDEEQSGDDG